MAVAPALAASFRDPAGFVFRRDGVLYRQVHESHRAHYRRFVESGLGDALIRDGLLIPHAEVDLPALPEDCCAILQPDGVGFVSHPHEWCPAQLRDAALVTLAIQKRALEHGMSLRDASAYNIQFHRGRPVLIDTLSFETYVEGRPWAPYRQFCQHFLAPLALMARADVRLGQLLRVHIDGIPLDLAASLLPWSTRLDFGLLTHVHLHARWQERHSEPAARREAGGVGRMGLLGTIDHLESTTRALKWRPPRTTWGDYYDGTNYSEAGFEHKRELVAAFLDRAAPRAVWDLGANTGVFSRLASARGVPTIAFDMDPAAVEKNWLEVAARNEKDLLPLLLDLTNPTPAFGWMSEERDGWLGRGPTDLVLALALVHHLAIGNNVPLDRIATMFARLGRTLVVEFVPREDSQVRRMLAVREDVFAGYTREAFERAMAREFTLEAREPVRDTARTLYLMTRRAA